MELSLIEGMHTVETLAKKLNMQHQSAINLISKLKKKKLATVSGGGRQKRIYTISKLPQQPTNGFYDIVNKHAEEKLAPAFQHYVHGKYTVENAIIDGILINDVRTKDALLPLFNHVNDWQKLFALAKKRALDTDVRKLYEKARSSMRVRKMPRRYQ